MRLIHRQGHLIIERLKEDSPYQLLYRKGGIDALKEPIFDIEGETSQEVINKLNELTYKEIDMTHFHYFTNTHNTTLSLDFIVEWEAVGSVKVARFEMSHKKPTSGNMRIKLDKLSDSRKKAAEDKVFQQVSKHNFAARTIGDLYLELLNRNLLEEGGGFCEDDDTNTNDFKKLKRQLKLICDDICKKARCTDRILIENTYYIRDPEPTAIRSILSNRLQPKSGQRACITDGKTFVEYDDILDKASINLHWEIADYNEETKKWEMGYVNQSRSVSEFLCAVLYERGYSGLRNIVNDHFVSVVSSYGDLIFDVDSSIISLDAELSNGTTANQLTKEIRF